MQADFSSLPFEYQDCNSFLAALDSDAQSSSSSNRSPNYFALSPQQILNGAYPPDDAGYVDSWQVDDVSRPARDQQTKESGSFGGFLQEDGKAYDGGAMNQTPPQFGAPMQQFQLAAAAGGPSEENSTSNNSMFSSPHSYNSDSETPRHGAAAARQEAGGGFPISPPAGFVAAAGAAGGSGVAVKTESPEHLRSPLGSGSESRPMSAYDSMYTGTNESAHGASASPENQPPLPPPPAANRRSTATTAKANGSRISKPKKEKTSHNMIEKRYRTNINDKILALRDCVPSLRCVAAGEPAAEDLEGLTPANKLNKATVLTKATEYILHLQKRNALLQQELNELRNSLGPGPGPGAAQAYAHHPGGPHPGSVNAAAAGGGVPRSSAASKMMMVGMAGMLGTSMAYGDASATAGDMRGLGALPGLALFTGMSGAGSASTTTAVVTLVKVLLIVGVFFHVVVLPLVGAIRRPSGGPSEKARAAAAAAAAASSDKDGCDAGELRRRTFLTATQSLAMPPAGASALVTAGYVVTAIAQVAVSALIGLDGYLTLVRGVWGGSSTAATENPTFRTFLLRAMDSQLCGGDADATRGRLAYGFVRSFLLAGSARRYMMQALHLRVLFHGVSSSLTQRLVDATASYLWSRAVALAASADGNSTEPDANNGNPLPPHLIQLLAEDPAVVFDPETVERAHRMVFNLGPRPATATPGVADTVGSDMAVRTSLDALAAWTAALDLHEATTRAVEHDEVDVELLDAAAAVSPPDSAVRERVAIAQALLILDDPSRVKLARDLVDARRSTGRGSNGAFGDVACPLRCAFIQAFLAAGRDQDAVELALQMRPESVTNLGLLGFLALWTTLARLAALQVPLAGKRNLEQLAAAARLWVGSELAENVGISLARRRELASDCVKLHMYFGGLDVDEGYASH